MVICYDDLCMDENIKIRGNVEVVVSRENLSDVHINKVLGFVAA